MESEALDPRIQGIRNLQRELMELNRAIGIIRGVLPRSSDVVISLEHQMIQRSKAIKIARLDWSGVEGRENGRG